MTRGFTSEDKPRSKKRYADYDELGIHEGVTCVHATERAILCKFGALQAWVPQECVHEDSEVYEKGNTGKLIVKASFARALAARLEEGGA